MMITTINLLFHTKNVYYIVIILNTIAQMPKKANLTMTFAKDRAGRNT